MTFIDDLSRRLANRIQLSSDGHKAYLDVVEGAFGGEIDYAMIVKMYGTAPESAKGRYSPAECTGIRKTKVTGNPDPKRVSTSYAERANLSIRMGHTPVYSPDQRLFKEGREPRARHRHQ